MNNVLNNTLNLFPSTTTPQQTQTKLQKLVYNATSNSRGPTEIQRTIAYSLYDSTTMRKSYSPNGIVDAWQTC